MIAIYWYRFQVTLTADVQRKGKLGDVIFMHSLGPGESTRAGRAVHSPIFFDWVNHRGTLASPDQVLPVTSS